MKKDCKYAKQRNYFPRGRVYICNRSGGGFVLDNDSCEDCVFYQQADEAKQ